MWLLLGLLSAVFLGIYDIFKKISLKNNAVIPVLFFSILTSSCLFLPFTFVSYYFPGRIEHTIFYVPRVDWHAHIFIFIKSIIVLSSWIFAYFAMKHLPITIASPIRSTQPVWVVLGALFFWGEKLSLYQMMGVGVTLISFYLFSVAGSRDGFSIKNNKWIWFIILATLTGAVSGLYDKYLMKEFDRFAVQVYYTYYQALLMGFVTLFFWFPTRKKTTPFVWKWSIVHISIFLVIADFCYFYALSMAGSKISRIWESNGRM